MTWGEIKTLIGAKAHDSDEIYINQGNGEKVSPTEIWVTVEDWGVEVDFQ